MSSKEEQKSSDLPPTQRHLFLFIFSKPGEIRKGLFRSTQCTGAKETLVRTSAIVSILQCDPKLQSCSGQKHFLLAGLLDSIMVLMNSEEMRRTFLLLLLFSGVFSETTRRAWD